MNICYVSRSERRAELPRVEFTVLPGFFVRNVTLNRRCTLDFGHSACTVRELTLPAQKAKNKALHHDPLISGVLVKQVVVGR